MRENFIAKKIQGKGAPSNSGEIKNTCPFAKTRIEFFNYINTLNNIYKGLKQKAA
jgi:hypothetical protein